MRTKEINIGISQLCDAVMTGVARFAAQNNRKIADADQAISVMKAEVRELLFGDSYTDERDCIRRGTIHQNVVISSVIASCILKIKFHKVLTHST